MTISANTPFPNLIPQNLESVTLMSDRSSATLGAELVYTQDASVSISGCCDLLQRQS
ncbi:MAG: hypothetical protein NTY89_15135 [Nostocales cyanobacterium LacPavin_0920_SED1_MAG_38_18]|nr:hypothetical protein [Nostocales cyanobacterium LacPavin_0920_SED1_MAG_38_18]